MHAITEIEMQKKTLVLLPTHEREAHFHIQIRVHVTPAKKNQKMPGETNPPSPEIKVSLWVGHVRIRPSSGANESKP